MGAIEGVLPGAEASAGGIDGTPGSRPPLPNNQAVEVERLIEALTDPRVYPRPAARVDVLQTHASVLFFVGGLVYKVKKAVNLGFLDFTTAERRRFFCHEEVRLNAALAPGVYRRVVGITRAGDHLIVDGPGEPIDYAVEMTRLPAGRMLDRLLEHGAVRPGDIDRIVAVVARFHAAAAHGSEVSRHGSPRSVRRKLERNLEQAAPFAGEWTDDPGPACPTVPHRVFEHIRAWNGRALREHDALLASRPARERIREGHGDMHAGNICLTPTGVVIYDRIEFDAAFRCCDVAAELAFLAMDLDYRDRRDLSRRLVDAYAARTGDPDVARLQDLYRCHFACVRGKVASIRAREAEVAEAGRRAAWKEAARYFQLAAGYTLGPSLILMCGLPGSGKTWAARQLAAPLGAVVLASDRVRKELAGMTATEHWRGPGPGPYTPEMTARTYAAILERADAALTTGHTVIADATFATKSLRAPFVFLSRRRGVPLLVVHLLTPDLVARARLAARAADPAEVSDADANVFESARARFEPPEEILAPHRLDAAPLAPEVLAGCAIERLVPTPA